MNPEALTVSPEEFRNLQRLVYRVAGIFLGENKQALVVGRLTRRLRELGLSSFGAYYRYVTSEGGAAELVQMLDRLCTNETSFFREWEHFRLLRERVLPRWEEAAASGARPKRIRVWSAGCSTGQEPFSIAMVLLDRFPPESGWEIEILATDLSTRVLEVARSATWPVEKARDIPPEYLKRFMLRGFGSQLGKVRAGPLLRSAVRFARFNLNEEATAPGAPFDLLFCRNVLIYFGPESRARVIRRLLSQLGHGGYLFLGHAETLNGVATSAQVVIPTVYTLPEPTLRERPKQRRLSCEWR